MARVRIAAFLYMLALLALPCSYALKSMLDIAGFPWIDPTLILGLAAFLLLKYPVRNTDAFWVVVVAFVSASIGSTLMKVSAEREHSPLYIIYLEPVRLLLSMIWFWVSIELWSIRREAIIRWLSASVAIQFAIATYLSLFYLDVVPVPDVIAFYLNGYKGRQSLWLGKWVIYRMAGTFIESPPFGLFMFSALAVFVLYSLNAERTRNCNRIWLKCGMAVSICGAIASLSDEVLLALSCFGLSWYVVKRGGTARHSARLKIAEAVVGIVLVGTLATYAAARVVSKWDEAITSSSSTSQDVLGKPGAERMFHTRYGVMQFEEQPLTLLTGLGPGRYGDYAVHTGIFPPTVAIGVTPVEWLVEYGAIGFLVIVVWIWKVGSQSRSQYGVLGPIACIALLAANMAQANWLWETWFFAMAVLCSPPLPQTRHDNELIGALQFQ